MNAAPWFRFLSLKSQIIDQVNLVHACFKTNNRHLFNSFFSPFGEGRGEEKLLEFFISEHLYSLTFCCCFEKFMLTGPYPIFPERCQTVQKSTVSAVKMEACPK